MSVLIRNMKMPKTCEECEFHCYHSYGEYVCVAAPMLYPFNLANCKGRRKNWCPLVEVPVPHGRLIDADELANKTFYSKTNAPYITYWRFVNAPTVIEAEATE